MTNPRYRLLALDLDGTLLDPGGLVSPATVAAIDRAIAAGVIPILCTGRRPRRAFPVARMLGLKTPVVCNSGALIKSPDQQTLWRADLARDLVNEVLDIFQRADEPAISFSDRSEREPDFVVAVERSGSPLFDDFLDHNRQHAEISSAWMNDAQRTHFHLCAVGVRSAMLTLEATLMERLDGQIQTFVQKSPRYAGTMCEVLRADANKWTAIEHLCRIWDIKSEEVCAVGDDMNDIPMLRGAGLGVAMGHSQASVIAAADRIIGTNAEDGVAQLINELLLSGSRIEGNRDDGIEFVDK